MAQLIVCDDYLFPEMEDCCSKWYPGREDCPSLDQPMNPDVDGVPYPVDAGEHDTQLISNVPKVTDYMCFVAFYPHQVESNCR